MSAAAVGSRTGGCLCGSVRFTADLTTLAFGACHCEMCRRWTGSALLGITVPSRNVQWEGDAQIARFQSSDWAERAHCRTCGSALFYHVTADGPHAENLEMPIGLFDDANGLTLSNEIYIDHKPDSFAYTGDHSRHTRKETLAKFGISEEEDLA
ncbi:GFA family protein [Pararhodobacter zhoushanensis]|uniref:GFA family protein n=1 Tax=Pararhodobacter zhoushanensis TaxID=2479545 RepID=A0ABT3GUF4_9RHOB|nr:GFA family protein [Pararhodobacter zhoushanensis]MCW1931160.1 GFA family protein [Pararhodobacter zhoushanensis]